MQRRFVATRVRPCVMREDRQSATRPNETWAMDFVHDQLVTGRKLGVLRIIDTFSGFSPAPFECDGGAGRAGHQDVRLKRDQFARQRLELFDRAIAIVDIQIATLRVAQAAQAIDEGGVVLLQTQRKERDARTGVGRAGLRRARRERPRRRAAEQREEFAPAVHSITSSARASTVAGMSKPSALAALRLMTSSNLTGCITGKSAGFVPLRMRPA